MSQQKVLNCLVCDKIDLDKEWSRDDVTTERIIELLIKHNDEFNEIRKELPIEQFEGTLISDGRAFMSKVFKICITFANQTEYSVVLKVSQHKQWKNYADSNGSGDSSPERDENDNCLREKQKEMMEIGERYHNIECCFYENFPPIAGCPTPKTFYVEPIDTYRNGLILMENLADSAAPIGFYQKANAEQLFAVARCAANLHFFADRDDLRKYWSSTVGFVYLDLFVDEFQITGFPLLKPFPELIELLDQVTPVFDRDFCYYAVLDKPREYNALVGCHGDMQPNNILFSTDKNGKTTSKIKALIDWQLIFAGNPFTDLCRFLIGAVDSDLRKECDYKAFEIYYNELERLYVQSGRQAPFTREQALELYELSICEQTGSYIILMPLVELRKHLLNLKPDQADVFLKRTTNAMKLILPLIEKHGLQRYGQKVDWRQMMYANS